MEEARRVERRLADIPSEDAHGNKRMLAEDEVATVPALQPAREKKTATAGERAAVLDCVDAIWRYPIKSMAGEKLPAVEMTARGLLGDRIYALVDKASNRTAVVRSWAAALLTYRSQFVTEPGPAHPCLTCGSPCLVASHSRRATPTLTNAFRPSSAGALP